MTLGNVGCKNCGLRAHSKNVTCRSVFPIFENSTLWMYEATIKARKDPDKQGEYLFGSNAVDYTKDSEPEIGLGQTLINYLQHPQSKIEDLKILLCVHDWVQDPGTESV